MTRVLAGDLGGTNTRLAIVSTDGGPRRWVTREDFHSRDHDSLEELVRSFLSRTNHPVAKATFGVAGPVVAGQASITNLPWVIDAPAAGRVWLVLGHISERCPGAGS